MGALGGARQLELGILPGQGLLAEVRVLEGGWAGRSLIECCWLMALGQGWQLPV